MYLLINISLLEEVSLLLHVLYSAGADEWIAVSVCMHADLVMTSYG